MNNAIMGAGSLWRRHWARRRKTGRFALYGTAHASQSSGTRPTMLSCPFAPRSARIVGACG